MSEAKRVHTLDQKNAELEKLLADLGAWLRYRTIPSIFGQFGANWATNPLAAPHPAEYLSSVTNPNPIREGPGAVPSGAAPTPPHTRRPPG